MSAKVKIQTGIKSNFKGTGDRIEIRLVLSEATC